MASQHKGLAGPDAMTLEECGPLGCGYARFSMFKFLVGLFVLFRREVDNVLDGIIYGALIGLGFAWFENIHYYVRVGEDGPVAMLSLAWVRGVLNGAGGHATFTGLTGFAFGVFRVVRHHPAR